MSERLYQQDFIDLLAEKYGMNKKDADKFVKEFFLLIEEALEKDKCVKIKGFGTFKLVDIESRESVNVNTGERFQIQGYTKVSFTPDTSLRDLINKPFSHFETVILNENTILEDTSVDESDDENEEVVEDEPKDQVELPIPDDVPIVEKEEGTPSSMPSKEPDLSAEGIIARELLVSTPVVEVEPPLKERNKPVSKKVENSPVPYLVSIIVFVLLLCGSALCFIYYPDIFDSADERNNNMENFHGSMQPVALPKDSVVREDTIAEVVTPLKEKILVEPVKRESETVKKENEPASKPVPFKLDSVNYTITGTKTTYTIKEGETLTKVSLRFYGTKALWPYIVKHNPDIIKNPDSVPFGTTIKIPELTRK